MLFMTAILNDKLEIINIVQKNPIKIRFSANLEVRLNDTTTGHPLPCHETSV